MRRTILPLIGLALLAGLPANTAAQAPDPTLELTPTPGAAPGQSLTLKARCAKGCTLRLRELSVLRFDKLGVQGAPSSTSPLKGTKQLPKGKTVSIKVALTGSTGVLARSLVDGGEYARVSVLADYKGPDGEHQVQRSIALRKPSLKKLIYAQDDGPVQPLPAPKSKVTRYRVTVSGVQRTKWSYNRDKTEGACTTVSNGSGTQVLRFSPDEAKLGKLTHRPNGKPYFDKRPSNFPQLFVGGKLSVDRKGTVNAGVRGECDGVFGGEQDGGPPPACNGKATFDSSIIIEYDADGRLGGFRLPMEDFAGNRGVDCPVETGPRSVGPMEMIWAFEGKADPSKAGNPGKYIVLLRAKRNESIPGGSVQTSVLYTVTFKKVR
jgi:hypothetical protein